MTIKVYSFDDFQDRVGDWMTAAFGADVARNLSERNHRFLEEALELVQAAGCTRAEALMLVDYVYGRPVGELEQEVGGVMITLTALVDAHRMSLLLASEKELTRIHEKIDVIREKQRSKPKSSPLPAHGCEWCTDPTHGAGECEYQVLAIRCASGRHKDFMRHEQREADDTLTITRICGVCDARVTVNRARP